MPIFSCLSFPDVLCYFPEIPGNAGRWGMHQVWAKGILSAENNMNLYRGCTHGCIYCDSRSACYHMNHAFEDIEVKINAPELLRDALKRKKQKCVITTGSMSDPYMPLEKETGLTRKCLEIIRDMGFGLAIQTKSDLILRDVELLKSIHQNCKCTAQITLTTMDEALCRVVEPHVCGTKRRLEVLEALHSAGIPTVVWLTPLLPFINDTKENLLSLLEGCRRAGVYGVVAFGLGLTLREGSRDYYYQQLDQYFPGLKERYIKTYRNAYLLPVPEENALFSLLRETCDRYGIKWKTDEVFSFMRQLNAPPPGEQISFF